MAVAYQVKYFKQIRGMSHSRKMRRIAKKSRRNRAKISNKQINK